MRRRINEASRGFSQLFVGREASGLCTQAVTRSVAEHSVGERPAGSHHGRELFQYD